MDSAKKIKIKDDTLHRSIYLNIGRNKIKK